MKITLTTAYKEFIAVHGHVADDAQLGVVDMLARLQDKIVKAESVPGRLQRMLPGRSAYADAGGIYLWGGVGRGKTMLMDLFYGSLDIKRKKRIHFHRMMRDIHNRLKAREELPDPLELVAADIAAEIRVLCFDEFYVSDIADAMLLGRLLDGLFRRGVILVTTSNAHPTDLYKNGSQRERFLPAIELLEKHTDVLEMDGGTDYRLNLLQEAGTYLTPLNDDSVDKLRHYFEEIASGDTLVGHTLQILGREVQTVRCAKGVAWFDFNEICDGPRSQDDYIEIARWYPTVIVSCIPLLDRELENPARRFIALVDEFYDRKVKLIVSAATPVDAMYDGGRLKFEFQRTASRLTEMQSSEYLHSEHLA